MVLTSRFTRVIVPFENVLYLNRYSYSDIRVVLKSEVEQWLIDHKHCPSWFMNNPWEAVFDYVHPNQAMLFKLTWG